MKKVKVMLTVMIVLGIVGGVLAFKSVRSNKYCTMATVNNACPTNSKCKGVQLGKIDPTGSLKCFVETNFTADCAVVQPFCNSTPAKITNN